MPSDPGDLVEARPPATGRTQLPSCPGFRAGRADPRGSNLFVLLSGVVLSFGGIIMIREGEPWGWLVFGFFALVALVGAVMLLPGAGRLLLDG